MLLKKYALGTMLLCTLMITVGCGKQENTEVNTTPQVNTEVSTTPETNVVETLNNKYSDDKLVKFFFDSSEKAMDLTNKEVLSAIEEINIDNTLTIEKGEELFGPDSLVKYTISQANSPIKLLIDGVVPVEGEEELTADYIRNIKLVFGNENTTLIRDMDFLSVQVETSTPMNVVSESYLVQAYNKIQEAFKTNTTGVTIDDVKTFIDKDITSYIKNAGELDRPGGTSLEDATIIDLEDNNTRLNITFDKGILVSSHLQVNNIDYTIEDKDYIDNYGILSEDRFIAKKQITSIDEVSEFFNTHAK